jgi:hypothetical protein
MFRNELERQGHLTLKELFGKDFRLDLGTMLVFIRSDFMPFSLDSDIGVFHVADHEVDEYK